MITPHQRIELEAIQQAQQNIHGSAVRTPLVRLDGGDGDSQIYLKLENLQPTNSFKIRGAGNTIAMADSDLLAQGVWTASAGNMAQAVGWHARERGLKCTVFVPDNAADTKIQRIQQLGCAVEKIPFEQWVDIIMTHKHPGMAGLFVHPVSDKHVMAGNGTIGVEILEDLPDVDAVVIPYGLGGLCCGIGSYLRQVKPQVKIYACETASASPLAASLRASEMVDVGYHPSFVDSMGTPMLLPDMWPLAKQLVDDALVMSLAQIADAVKQLAVRNRIVAEGAGAASVAAALAGKAGKGKIVCIVSGGNIDMDKLVTILEGQLP